ncbi:hypothetical protein B0H19DRAFT_1057144 [Mycena capillaripes]|nr:hypothetical protein B0H19DRAFT_1057144 [Mycena capillaripes]
MKRRRDPLDCTDYYDHSPTAALRSRTAKDCTRLPNTTSRAKISPGRGTPGKPQVGAQKHAGEDVGTLPQHRSSSTTQGDITTSALSPARAPTREHSQQNAGVQFCCAVAQKMSTGTPRLSICAGGEFLLKLQSRPCVPDTRASPHSWARQLRRSATYRGTRLANFICQRAQTKALRFFQIVLGRHVDFLNNRTKAMSSVTPDVESFFVIDLAYPASLAVARYLSLTTSMSDKFERSA